MARGLLCPGGMNRLLSLVFLLAACSSALPLPDPGGVERASSDACPTSIARVCADGVCDVDGLRLPARLDAWCPAAADRAGWVEAYPCGALQQVEGLSGDQGIEIYYDASGDAYAITRWVSDPPCQGACKLICYAGPADLHPADLPACTLSAGQPVDRCAQP